MKLYPHQEVVLNQTKDKNKVAYYLDMGLGKTFVGSEKAINLHQNIILVICQKSKVDDWVKHFENHYSYPNNLENNCYPYSVYNLTKWRQNEWKEIFITSLVAGQRVYIINYELAFRRSKLADLRGFTLILDESSMIQNETAKRSKFILKKLHPDNVILLSGTPTSGKYEKLWSQMNLLGWNISKKMYYRQYVDMQISDDGYPIIKGYKNVDRLKRKMREHGCIFMKTEEVLDLPEQNFIDVHVAEPKEYKHFMKNGIATINNVELVGDTTLTKLLYARQLCGMYNDAKLSAFEDILNSTEDRLIVFYNFTNELNKLLELISKTDRKISVVNGQVKDLSAYNSNSNSITFVQYQAGAMGLNLQKANKIVYFSPTLSSELFEQSKKRIHRIGQSEPCFYYQLKSGIEHKIYDTLAMRKDYTDKLFEEAIK